MCLHEWFSVSTCWPCDQLLTCPGVSSLALSGKSGKDDGQRDTIKNTTYECKISLFEMDEMKPSVIAVTHSFFLIPLIALRSALLSFSSVFWLQLNTPRASCQTSDTRSNLISERGTADQRAIIRLSRTKRYLSIYQCWCPLVIFDSRHNNMSVFSVNDAFRSQHKFRTFHLSTLMHKYFEHSAPKWCEE